MLGARLGRGGRARVATFGAILAITVALGVSPVHGETSASVSGRIVITPLRVNLTLSRSIVSAGTRISAKARVWNDGSVTVRDVAVSIRVDRVGLVVSRPLTRSVRSIAAHDARSITWSLCGAQPGVYVVLAQATIGGETVESDARILTIAGGRKGTC